VFFGDILEGINGLVGSDENIKEKEQSRANSEILAVEDLNYDKMMIFPYNMHQQEISIIFQNFLREFHAKNFTTTLKELLKIGL